MAIDVTEINSPGWWIVKGVKKLNARLPRLQRLAGYHDGEPPLPVPVGSGVSDAFKSFQKKSCTNFAELIVGSIRERCAVREIRTAVSDDQVDDVAWQIWKNNGLDVEFADVLENMLALSDAYMIVGLDEDGEVVITGEDPRQVVTFHNPVRQSEVRAAVKVFHDADEKRDYIYLFLPGQRLEDGSQSNARRWVAYRERSAPGKSISFSPSAYVWDEDRGGADGEELNHPVVPVVRFRNRRGIGEFEPHTDVLDRINHKTYNSMVIAAYQAFKQMVIQVDVEDAVDEDGNEIDSIPDNVLTTDPGSWIQLPYNSKVFQTAQADMQGIQSAIKDDIRELAAVTRRPLAMFAPDNESAAGAQANSEGLIFATEDKQIRCTAALVDVMYLAFLTAGDEERANKSKITIDWKPASRYTVTDKANASAQASKTLAKRTIMREIWQFTPEQVAQAEAESSDEALLTEELTGGGNAA
ncbi:phage portal protein [Leifsonia sp. F6_8S_P_1B]|uniref:Phage portal protein n=1 Tax=Leifsonia williamsii TaxID=3035919 RepID=A0ABT8KG26_9MICO|nr:phage portal protein [Leifsonia williamsii]MDN4616419.1 phage portal protein [Leifsonia williamsii]